MFQYQTFDDAPGMVDSKAKLAAFRLPNLEKLSFFDVGCNEGYYCGVALEQGASRVVGLDETAYFINAAKRWFPNAEFIQQSWNRLPEEKFDVVLHASCMHYISSIDQTVQHLRRLAACLNPNGVLVLEIGIAPQSTNELVTITRHDGSKVYYPTMMCFLEMVRNAGLVERFIGLSEPGDGIERKVFHCSLRRPTVLILLGASNVGKTRFSWGLVGLEHQRTASVDGATLASLRNDYPDVIEEFGEDLSALNPIDQYFLREGDRAATRVANILINEVESAEQRAAIKGWQHRTIVMEGLDPAKREHLLIMEKLKEMLQERRYICWTASREF